MTSVATRHVMQANKSTNTQPELLVREGLRAAGLAGYRLHWKKVPGRPDICYPGRRVAIFVNGCFWHRCPHCDLPLPHTNVEFWGAKFARNRARDARDTRLLVQDGWTVLVVWECRLRKGRREATLRELVREVGHAEQRPRRLGCALEIGSPRPWQLRQHLQRLRRRHGGR